MTSDFPWSAAAAARCGPDRVLRPSGSSAARPESAMQPNHAVLLLGLFQSFVPAQEPKSIPKKTSQSKREPKKPTSNGSRPRPDPHSSERTHGKTGNTDERKLRGILARRDPDPIPRRKVQATVLRARRLRKRAFSSARRQITSAAGAK